VLSPEHVAKSSLYLDDDLFLPDERKEEMYSFTVNSGDVIFPIVGTLGRAMVIPTGCGSAIINQRLARLKPDHRIITSEYLHLLLSKVAIYHELDNVQSKGSILEHITKERILGRYLPIPPISEQLSILDLLNAKLTRVDKVISHEENNINMLREFDTRLRAAVVTGKLDVREASTRLPDEDEGIEPVEEPENGGETDEEMGEETEAIGEEDAS